MRFQGLTSCLLALGILVSPSPSFASGTVTSTPTAKEVPQSAEPASSDSLLKQYLHRTSFDDASEQNRAVERSAGDKISESKCDEKLPERLAKGPQADKNMWLMECRALIHKVNTGSKDVASVAGRTAREQEIMADISRVSDVAAVAAIGATAVGQFAMRDTSQAKSLEKVANIQKTAGKAAYVTGATDVALGAYAYLAQKHRLENLQANLKQTSQAQGETIKVQASSVSGLNDAIEKTKQAAYKHMIIGAAKAGTGWMSMKMAKSNEEAAKNLRSLEMAQANPAPATSVVSGSTYVPTYTNNTPTFSIPNATSSSGSTTSLIRSTSPGSATRASTLPSGPALARTPAGALAPGGVSIPGESGAKRDGGGASALPSTKEESPATKEALGNSFELNLTGGGSRYSGGNNKSEDNGTGAIAGIFSNLLGQNNTSTSAATGINPEQIVQGGDYNESGVQSARDGVSSSGRSLFELSKAKHFQMLRAGRLSGPGEVISR